MPDQVQLVSSGALIPMDTFTRSAGSGTRPDRALKECRDCERSYFRSNGLGSWRRVDKAGEFMNERTVNVVGQQVKMASEREGYLAEAEPGSEE